MFLVTGFFERGFEKERGGERGGGKEGCLGGKKRNEKKNDFLRTENGLYERNNEDIN